MPGDGDGFVSNMPVTLYPDTVDIPSRDNSEAGYLRKLPTALVVSVASFD